MIRYYRQTSILELVQFFRLLNNKAFLWIQISIRIQNYLDIKSTIYEAMSKNPHLMDEESNPQSLNRLMLRDLICLHRYVWVG